MVDTNLLKELKQRLESTEDPKPENSLKFFEFFKQLSKSNEIFKKKIEKLDITAQLSFIDVEKKFWIRIKNGMFDYGEGEISNPSFNYITTFAISAGVLYGEIDPIDAYMAGDIKIQGGNLQSALAFQQVLALGMQLLDEMLENL